MGIIQFKNLSHKLKAWAAGDVLTLVTGTVFAQLLNLLAYPILTRFYAPEFFGVFSTISALASFVSNFALLRLDTIYQVAQKEEEDDILKSCLLIGLTITLSFILCVLFYVFFLDGLWISSFGAANWPWYMFFFLGAITVCNSFFSLSSQVYVKNLSYRRFASAQSFRTIITILVQLGLALFAAESLGLLAGLCVGLMSGLLIIWPFKREHIQSLVFSPLAATRNALAIIRNNSAFIKVDVLNAIVSGSAIVFYPVLIMFNFGPVEAGLYAVASRLVFISIDILCRSISTVFFQRFAQAQREGGQLTKIFVGTLAISFVFALIICLAIYLLMGPMVSLVFDHKWQNVGALSIYLLPTFFVRFVVGGIGNTPLALKKPNLLLFYNIAQIATIAASFYFVGRSGGIENMLLYSGIGLVVVSIPYVYVLWLETLKQSSI